ncbi:RabGAP/TBC, partial [Aureobasidium melanogenum]
MSDNEAKHSDETLQADQHANSTNQEDGRDADTFEDAADTISTADAHPEPQDPTAQPISHQGDNADDESRIATDKVHSDDTAPKLSTSIAPGAFDADDIEHVLTETVDHKKEIAPETVEQPSAVEEEHRPATEESLEQGAQSVTAASDQAESRPSTAKSLNDEVATAAGAQDKRSSIDIINQSTSDNDQDDMPRAAKSRQNTLESVPELPPAVPEKENDNEPVKGLSGDLPTLNYPPPPPPPQKSQTFMATSTVEKPPTTRKVSSPFAWFSRARKATSPSRPTSPRRNTASSLQSLTTNPDSNDDTSHQPTLKDRFHILRLQGESAISADDSLALPQG